MVKTRLSSKYQLVIPKEIRKVMGLRVGEDMTVLAKDGVITLVPQQSLKNLKGFLKGFNYKGYRDEEDR